LVASNTTIPNLKVNPRTRKLKKLISDYYIIIKVPVKIVLPAEGFLHMH